MIKSMWKWALVLGLMASGLAWAQQEPSINEIYAAAQAGKLDQAQLMVQQVLVSHPNSAKAHYVRSELYARQGKFDKARESLAAAEKLAPGLPFAKPDAVRALRAELSGTNAVPAVRSTPAPAAYTTSAPASSGNWVLPVLLTVGVITAGFFIFRRRAPQVQVMQPPYGNGTPYNGGLSGPQAFGSPAAPNPYGPQPYGPGYGAGYAQPQGSGLGGQIMGGVATGLAVGAGVMAAEAIGRNLMGGHEASRERVVTDWDNGSYAASPQRVDLNPDMGGNDFGMTDTSSWDDPVASGGSSSDWDT